MNYSKVLYEICEKYSESVSANKLFCTINSIDWKKRLIYRHKMLYDDFYLNRHFYMFKNLSHLRPFFYNSDKDILDLDIFGYTEKDIPKYSEKEYMEAENAHIEFLNIWHDYESD